MGIPFIDEVNGCYSSGIFNVCQVRRLIGTAKTVISVMPGLICNPETRRSGPRVASGITTRIALRSDKFYL
jgi:hypothetical protein